MLTSRTNLMPAATMERRTSTNSESSIEPMDISTKTASTDANSSGILKSSDHMDSDNFESDRDDTEYNDTFLRRENLRQLETNMMIMRKKFRFSMPNKNNNNNLQYNYDKMDTIGRIHADSNENNINANPISGDRQQQDVKYTCPICEKISMTQHEFTEHIRSHNNTDDSQNFTCQICFKVLSSASSLDRHVLVHTGERPFTCKYCHVTFTTNGNMHRHMRTHKQRDGENYESDGSTDSSVGSGNNNYTLEGKRKLTDDDGASLKRRLKTINNNNIVNNNKPLAQPQRLCCPVCMRNDFYNMLSLENHMDKEHPSIQAKCRYCEVVFKSHKALNAHKCQKSQPYAFTDFATEKFPLIAKSLSEQHNLRAPPPPSSIANQVYNCVKCHRSFPCAIAVDIHSKSCAGGDSPQDFSIRKRFHSETSTDEDVKRDDFFAHLELQTKSLQVSSNNTSSNLTDSFSPSIYGVAQMISADRTPSIGEIKQERRTPHQYDTKDLADIQSIINVTSSGGFLRQLDKSLTPLSLNKELPFSREEEEAQDAFTSEFRKMKLRGEFPCKLCTAIFPNLRALKGHNRIHLSAAGSGPYRCNMCPHSIHDKAALIRHMRTHNGDRPYECSICNYAFTTKANCERHLRNRHGKVTREEVKRSIIYHPSEDSSCDDPVKKMQIYNSSFDDDEQLSKDRSSTPVSHLKEMLSPEKNVKIQVKSMEQLTHSSYDDDDYEQDLDANANVDTSKPIDLSMDALDLTKKKDIVPPVDENEYEDDDDEEEEVAAPKIDLSIFEKNQQILMAQQQFLSDTLPKIDPAHYFQLSQLYRNFMFPPTGFPLHPLFLQNSFLPPTNPTAALQQTTAAKDCATRPLPPTTIPPGFPNSLMMNSLYNTVAPSNGTGTPSNLSGHNFMQPPTSSSKDQSNPPSRSGSPIPHSNVSQMLQPCLPPTSQSLPPQISSPSQNQQQLQLHHAVASPHQSHSPGPVKMVIKNGVLMPKQKQRRYRTERPFACEHCSARFTLRSNMERHIKQQHPQYWAQRQRSGHNILRRGSGGGVLTNPSSANNLMAASPQPPQQLNQPSASQMSSIPNQLSAISDQVKYAILAQQLKCRSNADMQPADYFANSQIAQNNFMNNNNHLHHLNNNNNSEMMPVQSIDDDDNESELIIDEDSEPEDLSSPKELSPSPPKQSVTAVNEAAKKVAENILEQAMRITNSMPPKSINLSAPTSGAKDFDLKIFPNLISRSEVTQPPPTQPHQSQSVAQSPMQAKEEGDLVSVSKLVDNATNNAMSFGNYFRSEPVAPENSDEEGLVASGSASESNNSGTEDPSPMAIQGKKKSAYSLAPNRVSCPYCQRMFPWSSSLRRHILTHTGQKPFKCSHCPLLFTTKSNCDRHLLRKHGNVESAVSLYVPIDDMPEPKKEPVAIAEENAKKSSPQQHGQQMASVQKSQSQIQPQPQQQTPPPPQPPMSQQPQSSIPQMTLAQVAAAATQMQLHIPQLKHEPLPNVTSSDLPFKCHLCDGSFAERIQCLEHIKAHHTQDFALLMSKGAIEVDGDQHMASAEDDDGKVENRGKYPDYANRKVICAFCMRRFWSTEDLRRHMRTHSGERPFQCDVCMRKFTLKHSMLRHQKKHTQTNTMSNANSASDLSDDEMSTTTNVQQSQFNSAAAAAAAFAAAKILKIPDLIPKETALLRKAALELAAGRPDSEETSELIGNLLGISDQGILNRVLLSSADEAAKLLGVEK